MWRKLAVAIAALVTGVLSSAAVSAPATDSTTAGGTSTSGDAADCKNVTAPADASDAVKEIYRQTAEQCARLQLQAVSSQLNAAQSKDVIQALTAIGNIQGNQGKVVNPEKANHIGEWFGKKLVYDAGMRVGQQLRGKLIGGKFVITTDASLAQSRDKLLVAQTLMREFKKSIDTAGANADKLLHGELAPESPKQAESERLALLPILSALPPAINAVRSISTLFRSDDALTALTISADTGSLIAGIVACLKPEERKLLVVPAYNTATPNRFLLDYELLRNDAASTRPLIARMDAIEKSLAGNKDSKAIEKVAKASGARKALESTLSAFDEYDKALNTIAAGATQSPLEQLTAASTFFSDPAQQYVVLSVAEIGASGGVRSNTFLPDKLEYQVTLQVIYLLVSASGTMLDSGSVSVGFATSMTMSQAAGRLQAASETPSCTAPLVY